MVESSRVSLSLDGVAVLRQLFMHGPVWNGNVISKKGRGELVGARLARHWDGWTWLTRQGLQAALDIGGRLREQDDPMRIKASRR